MAVQAARRNETASMGERKMGSDERTSAAQLDATQQDTAPRLSQAPNWRHRLLGVIYGPANHVRNTLRHLLGQQSIGICALIPAITRRAMAARCCWCGTAIAPAGACRAAG